MKNVLCTLSLWGIAMSIVANLSATPTPANVRSLLASYCAVQRSLAIDDLPAAKQAAHELRVTAVKIHASKPLIDGAGKVGNAAGLKIARTRFQPVSTEMINLVETVGTDGGIVYVAFCPMAFDRGGTWLQEDGETIANPYFGTLMPRCGRFIRSLGAGTDADHPMN